MDGDRDKFSPQEKVDLVLELLKRKKDLQTFAAEHRVSPELLAAWREEFLAKAARVFDHGKAEANLCRSVCGGGRRGQRLRRTSS